MIQLLHSSSLFIPKLYIYIYIYIYILGMDPGFQYKEKKKKIQISIHIILKNYKYSKSLFLNILRFNHLPTKTKQKQNNVFFNTRLTRIFVVVEVRAFTIVVLKILAFSISKIYFIYFITSRYNTPNIKCSILFNTSSKII